MSMSGRKRRGKGTRPLTGTIVIPGDKSLSHRALLLSALADGRSTIEGINDGDDVVRTGAAISALGATMGGNQLSSLVQVEGWGDRGPHEPAGVIDAGNSGTTARLLLGVVGRIEGTTVITGDRSLSSRPMLRVVAPLRAMGATIDGRAHGDRLPLSIRGGSLVGMDHSLSIASAQVKSALLLAGLGASGSTTVTEPHRSRDHTENMLRAAGVDISVDATTCSVTGGQRPDAMRWVVPGDISSAMFFVVAAALVGGSDLTISGVGLNPTRSGAVDVLRAMNADISVAVAGDACGEPVGDMMVRASTLHATTVSASAVPSLIDEIPVLAIAASQAEGRTVFEGVGELRAKESDRLTAIAEGLNSLGGDAEVDGDMLVVAGPTPLRGGSIDPLGDHRMAMAFAVAGLISGSTVQVKGWSCVDTSFPTFLDVLGRAQGGRR